MEKMKSIYYIMSCILKKVEIFLNFFNRIYPFLINWNHFSDIQIKYALCTYIVSRKIVFRCILNLMFVIQSYLSLHCIEKRSTFLRKLCILLKNRNNLENYFSQIHSQKFLSDMYALIKIVLYFCFLIFFLWCFINWEI